MAIAEVSVSRSADLTAKPWAIAINLVDIGHIINRLDVIIKKVQRLAKLNRQ